MGPTTLVSRDQVKNGELFLRRLAATAIAPSGAAWVKADDDGQPYLYIVSSGAEQSGFGSYHLLFRELRAFHESRPDPFDQIDSASIKFVGPSERIARAILQVSQQYPPTSPAWYGAGSLDRIPIDGAYIYPAALFAPAQPQPTA